MTDDVHTTGGEDPFFADEPETPPAATPQADQAAAPAAPVEQLPPPPAPPTQASPTSPADLQEPTLEPRPDLGEVPPPPPDHADYGLVAADTASPTEATGSQPPSPPMTWKEPSAWSETDETAAAPPAETPAPAAAPPAPAPAPSEAPGPAAGVIPPPVVPPLMMLDTPTDLPAVMSPARTADPTETGDGVAPPAGGQPAASGAPLLGAPASSTSDAQAGLQGPEFVALREQGMVDAPKEAAGPAREPLIAAEFSAKPSTMHGKSPVGLTNRTTKLGVLAIAAAIVVFLVIQFLPSKEAKGTPIRVSYDQGDTFGYHLHYLLEGQLTGEGLAAGNMTIGIDADAAMKVTNVEANGNATVNSTLSDIHVIVEPRPVGGDFSVPERASSSYVIAPSGEIVSGSLPLSAPLSAAQSSGQAVPPGLDGQGFPVFPIDGLAPGDTWKEDVTLPFAGDDLTMSSEYRMLKVDSSSGQKTAVISVTGAMPMDVSTTLTEILAASGSTPAEAGIPEGFDPTLTYSGDLNTDGTYWVDMVTGQLDHAYLTGDADFSMVIGGMDTGADLSASFKGKLTFSVQQLKPPTKRVKSPEISVESPAA